MSLLKEGTLIYSWSTATVPTQTAGPKIVSL